MSELIGVANFVALYGISEHERHDKAVRLARWALAHNAKVEYEIQNYGSEIFVKIMYAHVSGAELEVLEQMAKQHSDYPTNSAVQLFSICDILFYSGTQELVGLYNRDDTAPVPKCLKCGKLCAGNKGPIVIRSNKREWICQECWDAAFGKEEGEKDADSH